MIIETQNARRYLSDRYALAQTRVRVFSGSLALHLVMLAVTWDRSVFGETWAFAGLLFSAALGVIARRDGHQLVTLIEHLAVCPHCRERFVAQLHDNETRPGA